MQLNIFNVKILDMLDEKPLKRKSMIQEFLPGTFPFDLEINELAGASAEDRGAVFTRREIVDFILDLTGYESTSKLQDARLLEPAFGHGDFLLPAIERLLESIRIQGLKPDPKLLKDSIRGVELHYNSFDKTKGEIRQLLIREGLAVPDCEELIRAWILPADFLLTGFSQSFTHVIGNPPYVRHELIPSVLIKEYRRRFKTIYDRADIYIPFIEHSLNQLSESGVLGFICADRWTKNRYGGPLRQLVAKEFHLRIYVDKIGTEAFHSEVIAYPAIVVIANEPPGPTNFTKEPQIAAPVLKRLAKSLTGKSEKEVVRTTTIGDGPWTFDDSTALKLIRRLERAFPTLEEAGCKVGIGVATGADNVFIAPFETLNIEESRKLPLVMTRDIQSGHIEWGGRGVINPFGDNGKLVSLEDYPRLGEYLRTHEDFVRDRHVSRKNPNNWYRTIDRIYPAIVKKEKLLIPDIKGDAHIVYDDGKYYPHHNLYYITSEQWDLQALRVVLLSGIARLFIEAYSTRMHGNCLRFQAQYLRRIRIPFWKDIPKEVQSALRKAPKENSESWNLTVGELYTLSQEERDIIKDQWQSI